MESKTVLVMCVGFACDLVVKSIRKNEPDFVQFLVSVDSRKFVAERDSPCCKRRDDNGEFESMPSIIDQCNLRDTDRYGVTEIDHPDDLEHCIRVSTNLFNALREEFPDCTIITDVTPATKSMAFGLYFASHVFPNVELSILVGDRKKGDKTEVRPDSEVLNRHSRQAMFSVGHLLICDELLSRYDYEAVLVNIDELRRNESGLNSWLKRRLLDYVKWSRTFTSWDKFDHEQALEHLLSLPIFKERGRYQLYLEAVISQRQLLESRVNCDEEVEVKGSAEIVCDMLFNAQRRAENGRFDDAVARLYRSLEMLMQLRLVKQFGIITSNVRASQLPEELQQKYNLRDGRNKIDLVRGYDLLADLNDELGTAWNEKRSRFIGTLCYRNDSILAHGVTTIDVNTYEKVDAVIGGFIRSQLEDLFDGQGLALQLPRVIDDRARNSNN